MRPPPPASEARPVAEGLLSKHRVIDMQRKTLLGILRMSSKLLEGMLYSSVHGQVEASRNTEASSIWKTMALNKLVLLHQGGRDGSTNVAHIVVNYPSWGTHKATLSRPYDEHNISKRDVQIMS